MPSRIFDFMLRVLAEISAAKDWQNLDVSSTLYGLGPAKYLRFTGDFALPGYGQFSTAQPQ